MVARVWVGSAQGGTWTDSAGWSPAGVPQSGDSLTVSNAVVSVGGLTLDDIALTLGRSGYGGRSVGLAVDNVTGDAATSITVVGGGAAYLTVTDSLTIDGGVNVTASAGSQTLMEFDGSGTVAFGSSATVTVSANDRLTWSDSGGTTNAGAITLDSGSIYQNSPLANSGNLLVRDGGVYGQVGSLTNTGDLTLDDSTLNEGVAAPLINGGTLSLVNGSELNQSGALANTGSITLTDAYLVTSVSATLVNSGGTLAVSSGGHLNIYGTLTNDGSIVVNGGSLYTSQGTEVQPGIAFVSPGLIDGSGSISLANSGTIYANGVMSGAQRIAFLDATGRIYVNVASQFSPIITAMQAGDFIDLQNSHADTVTISGGSINVSYQGHLQATISTTLASGTLQFTTRDDGGLGTLLLTSDQTRVWSATSGNWYSAANWTTSGSTSAGAPLPGDTELVSSGTVVLDASEGMLEVASIHLRATAATAPATLVLDAATIDYPGAVVVDGEGRHGQVVISGYSTTYAPISAASVKGTLAIVGSGASATLENDRAIVAGQGALVTLSGLSLNNSGLIDAVGRIDIDSSVSIYGTSGYLEINNGGTLVVGGAITSGQTVTFGDTRGRLAIGQVANFSASINDVQQGDVIDLLGVTPDTVSYASGTLTVTSGGAAYALNVSTSNYYGTPNGVFTSASDGDGGTALTFKFTNPTVVDVSMPLAVVGSSTQMVSLLDILRQSFGDVPPQFTSLTLSPAYFDGDPTGFWGQAQQTPSGTGVNQGWYVLSGGSPVLVTSAITVTRDEVLAGDVEFQVGNALFSTASFTVPTVTSGGTATELTTYHLWSVDPAVTTYSAGSVQSAGSEVASINAYAGYYSGGMAVSNTDYCPWIGDDVAAGGGATMPWEDESTDPNDNEEGGFWRIAYNGAVSGSQIGNNWYEELQAGDVVRLGWASTDGDGLGQHTTTILQVNADGTATSAEVYDNNDYIDDGTSDYIGLHDATYWDATLPQSITIYRIESDQYLINGHVAGEFIQGSVFNNLIRPVGGGDTIAAGAGSNEIQGKLADIDGTSMADFNDGDTIDATDLAPAGATVSYDKVTGLLSLRSGSQSASMTLPTGLAETFAATSDGTGGTVVSVACFVAGTAIAVPGGEMSVEHLAAGDLVLTAAGAVRPVRWIGRRSYAGRFLAANPGVQPVCFQAGALGDGLPRRDLLVSPDHAMFLDGVLVPAGCLVNGTTIRAERALARVDYVHVELDSHDVLLAEGAPSESFLDDDSRAMFHNAADYPARTMDPGGFCAPRVNGGYALEAVRRLLSGQATRLAA